MTLQHSIPDTVPAPVSAVGDCQIDDASNSRGENFRHGYNNIDNPEGPSEVSSEEESDDEPELHSQLSDHYDGFDRVEDEDWEIVERGKRTANHTLRYISLISWKISPNNIIGCDSILLCTKGMPTLYPLQLGNLHRLPRIQV